MWGPLKKMKNTIIVIVSIVAVVFGGMWLNASSERDQAIAEWNMTKARVSLAEEFTNLSERWGDREDVDTLISNGQWELIRDRKLNYDQMIALAETVKDAAGSSYNMGWYAIDDTAFEEAVRNYNACKEALGE